MEVSENFKTLENEILNYSNESGSKLLSTMTLIREDMKLHHFKKSLSDEHWSTFTHILGKLKSGLFSDVDGIEVQTELFRILRNCCANCSSNQLAILRNEELLDGSLKLMKFLKQSYTNEDAGTLTIALRCSLQFFVNLVTGNEGAKKAFWNKIFSDEDTMFQDLINSPDARVRSYTAALLYNCMTEENRRVLMQSHQGRDVICSLTKQLVDHSDEDIDGSWELCCLESIAQDKHFFQLYQNIPVSARLVLLDLITEQISQSVSKENRKFDLPEQTLISLAELYTKDAMCLITLGEDLKEHNLLPIEVKKILLVFCTASTSPDYAPHLKQMDVLEPTLDVLKAAHLLGKSGNNAFTPVQDLDELAQLDESKLAEHPSFGLKGHLVRLIGNLCEKHKGNQDLVREMDGIPLLLDLTPLDANNPYIEQMVVFALSNLLQDNRDNQAVVYNIEKMDDLRNNPHLGELGVEIEDDGSSIRIRRPSRS